MRIRCARGSASGSGGAFGSGSTTGSPSTIGSAPTSGSGLVGASSTNVGGRSAVVSVASTGVPLLGVGVGTVCTLVGRSFGRRDDIAQQHRDGHRTDPARHRRQVAGDLAHVRVYVADQTGLGAGDAHVQHGSAGL